MNNFIKYAKRSDSFQTIYSGLQKGLKEQWTRGYAGSSIALLASFLYKETGRTCLLLTETIEEAENLHDDVALFVGEENSKYYPSWEVLPYEKKHPEDMIISLRMELLSELLQQKNSVIVAPVRAIMERLIDPLLFSEYMLDLKVGQSIKMEELLRKLVDWGFERSGMVTNIGEFSVRGGILDLYTFGTENPYRIEFWGDQIDSIREFDIVTQRSIKKAKEIKILPRREKGLLEKELILPKSQRDISDIFAYLPEDSIMLVDHPQNINRACGEIIDEVENLYESSSEQEEKLPHPEELYLYYHNLKEKIRKFQAIWVNDYEIHKKTLETELEIQPQESFQGNLELLRERLNEHLSEKYSCFILCDNQGQVERLDEILADLTDKIDILVGILHRGFVFPEAKFVLYTDHEIFGRYRRRRYKRVFKAGEAIKDYSLLNPGDYVVHINHGIGIYWGIRRLQIDSRKTDCLEIAYQDNDKLFVPVDQLKYIQKYSGSEGVRPDISKLGSNRWELKKAKTKKSIKDMTEELLKLYATRAAKRGFAFSPDQPWQKELEASFIYEETEDQLKATEEIKSDMQRTIPMDRLLCGDVGYGKTEVAIRAAFKVVLDGKQVAVLVPTTVLAQQHYNTFKERMADYPIRIHLLSRYRTPKEQKKSVEQLKSGAVDIIIGTHRLLSKDIDFKDLGVLIIDEEQRFGVAHKEKLKKYRKEVDVLTMTATPIPRTLQFSMMGIRDMSLIDTAPRGRVPIQTEIVEFKDKVIADAILREVDRGGQVYFLHNRVQTIDAMAGFIKRLVPQVRIGVAHGQMGGHRLEKAMLDFLDHRYDVLVCTTIIESGIDIPNVNTIIINRADRFGLAQLYQLRGRVGRSNRRAYAYLLTPKRKTLTKTARKRLKAIEEFTALGSGFKIALRDLEIRGAGNLLGAEQSGYINAVGFDLYTQLLKEAVQELRGEEVERLVDPKMSIAIDAYLPDTYVPDTRQKVMIYKDLSQMTKFEQISEKYEELQDRYGEIPEAAKALLETVGLRILGAQMNVAQVIIRDGNIYFEFTEGKAPSPHNIKKMVDRIEKPFEFKSGNTLGLIIKYEKLESYEILQLAQKVLLALQN